MVASASGIFYKMSSHPSGEPAPTPTHLALFEKFFEHAPDGVVVIDPNGKIVRVNSEAERMFGYSREELIGQSVEVLIPEGFKELHATERRGFLTSPRRRSMGAGLDLHARRKDGTEFPVDIMLSPVEAEEGLLVLSVIRDITERMKAEEALRSSEHQLQAILDNSIAVVYLKDLSGRYITINRHFEALFEVDRKQVAGKTDYDLFPKEMADRFRANDEKVVQAGSSLEFEEVVPQDDGLHTYISIKFPLFDASGAPYAVGGISTDITERKRAEEALRSSEEHFRSLVESVKDYAIFMLDREGRITSWNAGAEQIGGYRAEEIIGQHASRLLTPEDIERRKLERELELAAAQGRYEEEGWRVKKDGTRFRANVIVSALKGESGQVRGFSVVTRDITERRRAQEALLLEVTNVLLSQLDIRQLLAAVSGSLRQVVPHDCASLALYDPAAKKLRLQILTAPSHAEVPEREAWLPLEGSPAGWVFKTREPLVLDRMESDRFDPVTLRRWVALGIKSACWFPLISHGRVLGTLQVGSEREAAFTSKELSLLGLVALQVAVALDNAMAFRQIAELRDRLAEEKLYLEDELRTEYNFEEIIGESSGLKRVLKQVETVASTEATVLILGETGTGKELIARAIHSLSPRRERTFVKLSCAAIPTGLLESELFGHEKGAFTGAISQKIGRLELAHQGTLFLDEVGDIPLEIQPKLLRVLQEKEFERLGSTRTILVDVRLIAATNRDLDQMVKDSRFRSDLYYRLRVFPIVVPPLRERREDIPRLVHYFAQKHAQRMAKRIETIPPEAIEALNRWQWPGNIRELENLIERAVILSPGSVLRVPLAELQELTETEHAATTTLEEAEREHILRTLRETRGVIGGRQGAAARLGIKRTTLNSRMQKLGISRTDV